MHLTEQMVETADQQRHGSLSRRSRCATQHARLWDDGNCCRWIVFVSFTVYGAWMVAVSHCRQTVYLRNVSKNETINQLLACNGSILCICNNDCYVTFFQRIPICAILAWLHQTQNPAIHILSSCPIHCLSMCLQTILAIKLCSRFSHHSSTN